ncbi:MAG: hypothetical protein JXB49_00070, partial [Bacteroidales bacterium]|nr:hypothetical protein [Bacteroidales bacterium]
TKKKLPAWWSYCLWLLLLVRMLIPFGVETPVSVYNYVPAPPENRSYMPYLEEHRLYIPFIQPPPDASPAEIPTGKELQNKPVNSKQDNHVVSATEISGFNLSFSEALLILWIVGVMAFGIATIYKNLRFWLYIKREEPINDVGIIKLFDECKSTLGIHKRIEIIVTDSVKSPAIFGYINPQLLLPPQFLDTLNTDELHCIFMHELGHVKRHDIGITWLATFYQVIYWFNPLVWYAFHHLRADQEAACDAYVLSKIKQVRPTDYARTIVNLLERFVQNRQLPSLAGIIENKSQIDKRISMILDYKRITNKLTIISVLMLFIVAGVFFSCSNRRLSDLGSGKAEMTQPEKSDMKPYKNDDWNFSLDIPNQWSTSPSLPAYLANKGELISFGSNDNGIEALRIFMYPYNPELPLTETRDRLEKELKNIGYGNFSSSETTIGLKKALILDYDKEVEDVTLRAHTYLVQYKSTICLLNFATTHPDPTFELYDRIAKTFERHETSVVRGMKKYVSPDGNISMEIPANWNPMPIFKVYNELIRFGTPQDGPIAVIHNPEYSPWKSLESFRTWTQGISPNSGWKEFTNSEAILNGRKTLIDDSNNGSLSVREYFFEDAGYKYWIAFYGNTNNGIPADRLEVYERVIESIVIHKKPEVAGFKEYTGMDNKKPIPSGMKRYINPDDDYTVDVPGDWQPYAQETEYGKTYLFGKSENGLAAVLYPRAYSPGLTLDERRNNQVKVNTDAGWNILGKSETTINGSKVLTLDSNQGVTNVRNYFFKEGDYIHSVLFYSSNTEGIPADRIEEYERVMETINILNTGQDLEYSTDSSTARADALPVQLQFRFAENKPGMGLEEMTASLSNRKVYLHKKCVLSNADIQAASAVRTKDGFGISVIFTEDGGKKFAEISKDNIDRMLGIVVDGKLIAAPVIRVPITGGKAFIEGKFTLEEAKRIARGIVGEYTGPDPEKSMVTSKDINIAFGYDDNDYPITNGMINNVYKKHKYILYPPEPAIFFKDKDSRQVIFMELETDFHRFYIYHFYVNEVPDELIQKFQAIAKDNIIDVDVPTKFKDLIKDAYIIENKYFTTKLNFRLGMSSKEAISIYGEPTRTTKEYNSTKLIWDYRTILNGKIHSDPKKGIILGEDISQELFDKVKWGYLLEITFSNDKAGFIKMYNGIP